MQKAVKKIVKNGHLFKTRLKKIQFLTLMANFMFIVIEMI